MVVEVLERSRNIISCLCYLADGVASGSVNKIFGFPSAPKHLAVCRLVKKQKNKNKQTTGPNLFVYNLSKHKVA